MKTNKTLKALVLSLAMAIGMLLPATMNAQTDGFFRGDEDYENREIGLTGDINHQAFGQDVPAPLGSGLIVLLSAGLGYVALKKKED